MSDMARRIAALSPEQREVLMSRLKAEQPSLAPTTALPDLVPRPEERFEPFPLTDVQEVYWAGRSGYYDLSTPGNSANIYLEYQILEHRWGSVRTFDERFEEALGRMIARHDNLRLVTMPGGRQKVLEEVPPYRIERMDLRGLPPAKVEARLEEVRERFRYSRAEPGEWPLFSFLMSRLDSDEIRLHVRFDCWLIDGLSRDVLVSDLMSVIDDPELRLPPVECTYRDYALAWQAIGESEAYRRARDYWHARIPGLPAAPDLPLAACLGQSAGARFETRFADHSGTVMESGDWERFKAHASRHGLMPSMPLIAAMVEVLRAWSRDPRFILGLEGSYWPPVHAYIRKVVGNFNTVYILDADQLDGTFSSRAGSLQEQMGEILDHRAFSGHQVLREIQRRQGGGTRATMPIMFNSLVEYAHRSYDENRELPELPPDKIHLGQAELSGNMPQFYMLPTVYESQEGGLSFKLQVVEELFPPGMVEDFRDAFTGLLRRLAGEAEAWDAERLDLVPTAQLEERAGVREEVPAENEATLYSLISDRGAAEPGRVAIVTPDRSLTYGELLEEARGLARRLSDLGVGPGEPVAAVTDRGWQQAVAVLGTLASGAACLQLEDDDQLAQLLERRAIRKVVTRAEIDARTRWPEGLQRFCVDADDATSPAETFHTAAGDDLAYLVETPEADAPPVAIEHRAAVVTVQALCRRLEIGPEDRLLSLSPPASDLALCELLAPLTIGASVVLPAAGDRDVASWSRLALDQRATPWSSTPVWLGRLAAGLEEMEAEPRTSLTGRLRSGLASVGRALGLRPARAVPDSLRGVLAGLDTLPLDLADRLRRLAPGARVFHLGGFPEAATICAVHEVDKVTSGAIRIPIGRPLGGCTLQVLDHQLEPRPDWVAGELYVGGSHLARGYWKDMAATRERFIVHPRSGERLFRTGQLACHRPGGNVELLGRPDEYRVDLWGYGAEPREVEAALERHSAIREAAAVAHPGADGKNRMVAFYVLRSGETLATEDVESYLQAQLPIHLVPAAAEPLTELPVTCSGTVDRAALRERAVRGEPGEPLGHDEPQDELEQELSELFAEALESDSVGLRQGFFELGGSSFSAVLLLDRVRQRFGVGAGLVTFFYKPTVAHLAELVRREKAEPSEEPAPAEKAPKEKSRAINREVDLEKTSVFKKLERFMLLWFGQTISGFGTGLGSFALGVWVYQATGSVTSFAMILVVGSVTAMVVAPFAGVIVDRYDRKWVMIIADTASALMTLLMAFLLFTDRMQPWYVHPIIFWMATCVAFQRPAFTATISMIVPPEELTRAAGMNRTSASVSQIITPPLAAVLVGIIGYHGVFIIDFVTFLVAVGIILTMKIPRPTPSAPPETAAAEPAAAGTTEAPTAAGRSTFFTEMAYGWRYIRARPGLLRLLLLFACTNFSVALVQVLLTPLILNFSNITELAMVNSAASLGVLLGALALTYWGGPKVRVHGIFAFLMLQGAILLLAGFQPSIALIASAAAVFMFASPFIGGCSQAIWQSKVAFDAQGRVLSIRQIVATGLTPIALLTAAPIADRIMEPLLAEGGALAGTVGQVIGVGPGRGVAFMFILLGLFMMTVVLLAFTNPRLRHVEAELPDARLQRG